MYSKSINKTVALCIFAIASSGAVSAQAQNLPEEGKRYFAEAQCATCHSVTSKKEASHVGPALYGVTKKPGRSKEWLVSWISDPEGMLAKKDKLALQILKENNNAVMTGMLKALNKKADGTTDDALINKKAVAIYEYLKQNDSQPEGGAAGGAKKKKN